MKEHEVDQFPGMRKALDRRRFLQLGAAGAAAAVVAACGSSSNNASSGSATTTATTAAGSSTSGAATSGATTSAVSGAGAKVSTGGGGKDGTIKIGYVSPVTGALAGFGEADAFSLKQMNDLFKDGLMVQGKSYKVQIHQQDSQSDPNKAGELASKLILDDNVDLILVGGTPETTNPVCDQAEANGVPAVATACPWQPWFFRQANADPAKGYTWTFDMFWGLEDVEANYLDIWGSTTTNKTCAGLFPNDGDGNAWGDAEKGFPSVVGPKGYKTVDPGRYQDGTDDFSAQIASSSKPTARSSTAFPSRRTSPPSGSRRSSRASSPSWPRSPRRSSSRPPSRPSATRRSGWRRRCGGAPTIPSPAR